MDNLDINEIALRHLGETAQNIDCIQGKGEVNEIYVLTLGSSKYVVRIDPEESTSDRLQKEAWCIERAKESGILVPETLGVGLQNDHPYILQSFMDGTHGADIDTAGQKLIWRKLGEYARKIHAIKVTGFDEQMSSPGVFNGNWASYLDYNISSLNDDDRLVSLGIITVDQSKLFKEILLQLKDAELHFGLIHNDLSLKNTILIAADGKVCLLDWGSVGVDVIPHMDFAEIIHSSLKEDDPEFTIFLEGYGMEREEFDAIKPHMRKLQLLRLTDKVRWAIDRKPDVVRQKAHELKGTMASFLR